MNLCWQSNVSPLNMLSMLVITFLPRSKRLLISWLQSSSVVIGKAKYPCRKTMYSVSNVNCKSFVYMSPVLPLSIWFCIWGRGGKKEKKKERRGKSERYLDLLEIIQHWFWANTIMQIYNFMTFSWQEWGLLRWDDQRSFYLSTSHGKL